MLTQGLGRGLSSSLSVYLFNAYLSMSITCRVGKDGRESRSLYGGNEGGVSLLGVSLERGIDVSLRDWEEDPVDDVDHAVRSLDVGFEEAGSVHRDHLL